VRCTGHERYALVNSSDSRRPDQPKTCGDGPPHPVPFRCIDYRITDTVAGSPTPRSQVAVLVPSKRLTGAWTMDCISKRRLKRYWNSSALSH
jgi:hypothetical protein